MRPTAPRSVWDDDVPEQVRDAATKGLEAAKREDLRTAYGYFLRAQKAAGRERFDDLTFLLNIAGLGSGEVTKWNDRLSRAREAFRVSTRRIEWLVILHEIVFADATGIQLAHRQAQDKLWYDTSPAMAGSLSGITWLAGQAVLRQEAKIRGSFDALGQQILWQVIRNLRGIGSGQTTDDVLPGALFEVERLADQLAEEPTGKHLVAQLYTELLALPNEMWMSESQDDQQAPSVEELRERLAVRLEVVQAATRGAGCLGSLSALIIGALAIALGTIVLSAVLLDGLLS
jgi:hypothetical protein